MLSDVAFKQLKSKDKAFKVTDRDGIYTHVRYEILLYVSVAYGECQRLLAR